VIHRLELYPCFIHLYRRRSRKRNHDDRGLLRRETAARGTVDRTKNRRKRNNRVGRPQDERRLFKPSQCQRRRRARMGARLHRRHAHLDDIRAIETGTQTLLQVFTDHFATKRVRLAAPGFHAESRPSSPDATGDVRQ